MSIRDTLELLRDAGLGSMTGGGAEIFDAEVRDEICRGKETAAEWLDVHRTWQRHGWPQHVHNALRTYRNPRSARLITCASCANWQDETHGFTGFVPFAFEPQNYGARARQAGLGI